MLSCTPKCNEEHIRSLSTAWHLIQSTAFTQAEYKVESFQAAEIP